jgi:hypothetical protein
MKYSFSFRLFKTKRNTKNENKLEPDDSQTRFVDAHGTPQLDSRSHEYMKNNTQ